MVTKLEVWDQNITNLQRRKTLVENLIGAFGFKSIYDTETQITKEDLQRGVQYIADNIDNYKSIFPKSTVSSLYSELEKDNTRKCICVLRQILKYMNMSLITNREQYRNEGKMAANYTHKLAS